MKKVIIPILALTIAVTASATQFTLTGMAAGKSKVVNIQYHGNSFNVYAGAVLGKLDSGPTFDSYCVDLDHWDHLGDSYAVNLRMMSEQGPFGTRAAWLFNQYSGVVNSSDKGAALQLAIWDVIADGGDGISHGVFRASSNSTVNSLAGQYLAASAGQVSSAHWLQAVNHGRNGDRNQNFMAAVPEPSALAALLIGSVTLLRRKSRSK